jgi:hypothetical protein
MFTNSDDYEIFVAEIGGTRLDGSDRRVDKQVFTGSFFKSQNGSTYTAYQDIDLMFKLNVCDFTVGTTQITLDNVIPTSNIDYDVIKEEIYKTIPKHKYYKALYGKKKFFHLLTDDEKRLAYVQAISNDITFMETNTYLKKNLGWVDEDGNILTNEVIVKMYK